MAPGGSQEIKRLDENLTAFFFVNTCGFTMKVKPRVKPKLSWRMVTNLCLGIYIAQAEDEEFSVVDAV